MCYFMQQLFMWPILLLLLLLLWAYVAPCTQHCAHRSELLWNKRTISAALLAVIHWNNLENFETLKQVSFGKISFKLWMKVIQITPKKNSIVFFVIRMCLLPSARNIYYPRKSEGICSLWRWFVYLSVCLPVTTITKKIVDGFVPNFMGRFLGGKGETKFVFCNDR